jgi:alginate O-acetyltransferase complex protein AlgI
LGFSYIAFRLIHTLRDRQTGRLPLVNLREYVTYAVFFPALTAGPIDRLERFTPQLRQPAPLDLMPGGQRLLVGLFKKFVLADSLGLVALNPINAGQIETTGWTWLVLYAFSLQILLDFSGYTDIAIGMALLMGIRLPENFNRPYRRPNLTQFWNHWHMTLTFWFRAYFFNPLARSLRSGQMKLPVWIVILVTQVLTMLLIGLWHGITANFAFWGLWHGAGSVRAKPLVRLGLTSIEALFGRAATTAGRAGSWRSTAHLSLCHPGLGLVCTTRPGSGIGCAAPLNWIIE